MSAPAIERRIFVVGVPRSGTTLVQSLLAAHSEVTSFTESHFFSRHFRPLARFSAAVLTRDPTARVGEFLAENGVETDIATAIVERVRRAVPARLLLPLRSRAVARQLLWVLDRLALLRGATVWVEKTPRHLRQVPFLEQLCGGDVRPLFVHVIRGGLETVASLHTASRSWERPYDLDACVARWNADVGLSLARAGAPRDRFVFYEELTCRPRATLERLLAGLGLGWEPQILDRYGEISGRLITADETWKADVGRGLRPSATSGQALSSEQRQRVETGLRHDLYEQLRRRTSP